MTNQGEMHNQETLSEKSWLGYQASDGGQRLLSYPANRHCCILYEGSLMWINEPSVIGCVPAEWTHHRQEKVLDEFGYSLHYLARFAICKKIINLKIILAHHSFQNCQAEKQQAFQEKHWKVRVDIKYVFVLSCPWGSIFDTGNPAINVQMDN